MLRNMSIYRITSFGLFLLIVNGVFSFDAHEVKSVSVMEGETVTLHTHLTHIRRYDHILWMFGPQEKHIAELYKRSIDMLDGSKLFGEWTLWLDSQTGSLTITNISTSHTGLYKQIIRNRETYNAPHHMQFNVTVYDHLSMAISAGVISLVLIVHAAGLILLYRKCKHKSKKVVQREEEEVHYIDTVFLRKNKQMKTSGTGEHIYSSVK
ncbi:uncharacterized protein LOC130429383 isoform X2 [Triplophysa dalaica]|uniref:uncharacterized protein LOC130429323 isoform X2 n=1 Tax=Triplophysa dalaica TaxID=1582913 RepID=UPI0024E038E0|nr:uncharacterized protein LOC130429323 isoform X2 [Triplophysa dalaica]XP_056613891.1 uncharacterized protein LOC130429383 isoform X2 [Triplophysa dalaica]